MCAHGYMHMISFDTSLKATLSRKTFLLQCRIRASLVLALLLGFSPSKPLQHFLLRGVHELQWDSLLPQPQFQHSAQCIIVHRPINNFHIKFCFNWSPTCPAKISLSLTSSGQQLISFIPSWSPKGKKRLYIGCAWAIGPAYEVVESLLCWRRQCVYV